MQHCPTWWCVTSNRSLSFSCPLSSELGAFQKSQGQNLALTVKSRQSMQVKSVAPLYNCSNLAQCLQEQAGLLAPPGTLTAKSQQSIQMKTVKPYYHCCVLARS